MIRSNQRGHRGLVASNTPKDPPGDSALKDWGAPTNPLIGEYMMYMCLPGGRPSSRLQGIIFDSAANPILLSKTGSAKQQNRAEGRKGKKADPQRMLWKKGIQTNQPIKG